VTDHEDQPVADEDNRQETGDTSHSLTGTPDDTSEVARLRQRLAYYESFDRLIQENIAHSADLMRETVELRERTQAELDRMREEIERSRREAEERIEADRLSQRSIFASLVQELSAVQESAERLTRRVSEAVSQIGDETPRLGQATGDAGIRQDQQPAPQVDEITGGPSTSDPFRPVNESEAIAATQDEPTDSGTFGLLPGEMSTGDQSGETPTADTAADESPAIPLPAAEASGPSEGEIAPYDDQSHTHQGEAADVPRDEDVVPFTWSDDMDVPVNEETEGGSGAPKLEEVASLFSSDQVSAEDDAANVEAISPVSNGQDQGASELEAAEHAPAEEAGPEGMATEPRAVTVLVHGVPRAATALSLQRHLAGLDHVSSVEAREYAEGILRLQVTASRPLEFEDLARWEDGQGIEPVHIHTDIIEVRLAGGDF
jgi:hypothetical protein